MLKDNLIGSYYPFFLTNKALGEAAYVYQLGSPSYNKSTLAVYMSLQKVCEKTDTLKGTEKPGNDTDILFATFPEEYINSLRGEDNTINFRKVNWKVQMGRLIRDNNIAIVQNKLGGMPMFEMSGENIVPQQNLIINLRYSLKNILYDLQEGNVVDVLVCRDKFATYKIYKNADGLLALEQIGLYSNKDMLLRNNLLSKETSEVGKYITTKTYKSTGDLLFGIKDVERDSFHRRG